MSDTAPRTAAGRVLLSTLADLGLAHAPNGTAGRLIRQIEAKAASAAREELAAQVQALRGDLDEKQQLWGPHRSGYYLRAWEVLDRLAAPQADEPGGGA